MIVVYADLRKIDWTNSLINYQVVDSRDQLKADEKTLFVLAQTKEYVEMEELKNATFYFPYSTQTIDSLALKQKLYFDLENYPFYNRIVALMGDEKKKGVLRFHRTVKSIDDLPIFIGDLYILIALFGKPEDIQVKQTKRTEQYFHQICLVNFGHGRLAHIECTVATQERIEFEWSGVGMIMEFDSEQMEPIKPSSNDLLSMKYSVDSIVSNAHEVTEALIGELNQLSMLLTGGEQA